MTQLNQRKAQFIKNAANIQLADYAVKYDDCSAQGLGGKILPADEYRTPFQRDRDRILYSHSFKRLAHKTQLFLTTGLSEHSRTRLTHTLEVAQLSRTIGQSLGLNLELIEAIAIGHDVGHTPFGHQGERTLNQIMSGKEALDGKRMSHHLHDGGGFKHNYQGVRILTHLEKKEKTSAKTGKRSNKSKGSNGLQLTVLTLEGIFKHTGVEYKNGNRPSYPDQSIFEQLHPKIKHSITLEGQVVAAADEIVQKAHDLEDGLLMKIISRDNVKKWRPLKTIGITEHHPLWCADAHEVSMWAIDVSSIIINRAVTDLLYRVRNTKVPAWSDKRILKNNYLDVDKLVPWFAALDKLMRATLANSLKVSKMDGRARFIITHLFKAYIANPRQLPGATLLEYKEMLINKFKADPTVGPESASINHVRNLLREIRNACKTPYTKPRLFDLKDKPVRQILALFKKMGKAKSPDNIREIIGLQNASLLPLIARDKIFLRCVADHIASMSDSYANKEYHELYIPPV